jgi:hypothetical protein
MNLLPCTTNKSSLQNITDLINDNSTGSKKTALIQSLKDITTSCDNTIDDYINGKERKPFFSLPKISLPTFLNTSKDVLYDKHSKFMRRIFSKYVIPKMYEEIKDYSDINNGILDISIYGNVYELFEKQDMLKDIYVDKFFEIYYETSISANDGRSTYYLYLTKEDGKYQIYGIKPPFKMTNKLLKYTEGIGSSGSQLVDYPVVEYNIKYITKINISKEAHKNITKFLTTHNMDQLSKIQGGGKKATKLPKKEILGKLRCIYKVPGSKKDHIKHKGILITVTDYKKHMKAKAKKPKAKKLQQVTKL